MIRTIIALVAWFFAFGVAATYGGIWHSHSYPTPNVRVQFIGGATESGTLRRAWDRDWVLTRVDGSELRFPDAADVVLGFEPPAKSLGYWQQWRAWGPVVVVSWCFLLFVFWPGLRRFIKWPFNGRN